MQFLLLPRQLLTLPSSVKIEQVSRCVEGEEVIIHFRGKVYFSNVIIKS